MTRGFCFSLYVFQNLIVQKRFLAPEKCLDGAIIRDQNHTYLLGSVLSFNDCLGYIIIRGKGRFATATPVTGRDRGHM